MEQTNTRSFLSCLCFIFFFINSLELITIAKGNPSFVLTNETDHQALLAIKDLIQGDPLGALSSWNHSIHFCNWQGVSCGYRHQRVIVLNLSSLALVGSVSPQIGNLTFLRRIHLGNNSFHGEIPQELGKLFRLRYLQLVNNSFQGEFPTNSTHCSHLRFIDISGNHLGGKIPTELGSLSNLSYLYLESNRLTGTIPLSIGNLSNLRALGLMYNNLEGNIPTQLGQLSNLEFLQLSANNLSGEMENSPLLKIAEQDLHQLGLLQQAVRHLFPRVLLQLSTQTSSTSSAILRGVNCCLAANYSEFGPRNKRGMTFLNFHIPVAVNSIVLCLLH